MQPTLRAAAMHRDFHITDHRVDDTLTLNLHGELDLATVDQVREAVAVAADGQAAIVIVLDDLEFIDSTGMRLLLELNANQTSPPVLFADPSEPVSRLLDLTGVRDMLRWRQN